MNDTQLLPVSPTTLGRLFEFTYNVTLQNVAGFTHEESLREPPSAGNPLNWVVGHIVATRNHTLNTLGRDIFWSDEDIARYDRGSKPYADGWEALPFEKVLADYDASQNTLREALAALTPEQLSAPLPEDKNPFKLGSLGEMLAAFNFHEAYHAGQTGILRRILGREGAIG